MPVVPCRPLRDTPGLDTPGLDEEVAMTSAISELATRFSGQLLQPADAGYEEARRVHNGLIDKRPILIARCRVRPRELADICEGACGLMWFGVMWGQDFSPGRSPGWRDDVSRE
jgi:hypothetical protein